MGNKVMIVDDKPDVCKSLKSVLETQDYDIITVSNGVECIKELEKGFKGIILINLMIPEMDGML
jgi:CheY-like chemotaxis protein